MKKIVVAVAAAALMLFGGAFLWARAVFTGETVRAALAAQLSSTLGQPVTIGRISASAFPRIEIHLGDVAIGKPASVRFDDLRVATDFRALLSRRIEHGSVRLDGARIQLPLPAFKMLAASGEAPQRRSSPVEIVSIDEIVLHGVEIVSGGRTLGGDVELEPRGAELLLRRASLSADGTTITATGRIADVSGPSGQIDLKASALNVDQLARFASAFSGGAGVDRRAPPSRRRTGPDVMNLTVSLDAERATFRGLAVEKFTGRAHVDAHAVTLDPIRFQVFGGRYDGSVTFTPAGDALAFRARATVADLDAAAATRFAGNPDTISGRLSARLDCAGRASDAADIASTLRGTARVDIVKGVVKNLGLVRTVVVATSMRSGRSGAGGGSSDEPFSSLGATLKIGDGALTTDDLLFESENLVMDAQGAVRLTTSTVNMKARIQLSEALSQEAGRDLVRYTQESGRVTLPATVTGPVASPHVSIDAADLTKRAIRNAVNDQVEKRLGSDPVKKGLFGLFKR
jgi:uncharacterized protein involved in outer membrane biogenesis